MTEAQVKHMVDRFLGWKLPRDAFNPDCGITFDKGPFNTHTSHPRVHEPSGTNLFDAEQATAMVRYMLDGLPDASPRLTISKEACIAAAKREGGHEAGAGAIARDPH